MNILYKVPQACPSVCLSVTLKSYACMSPPTWIPSARNVVDTYRGFVIGIKNHWPNYILSFILVIIDLKLCIIAFLFCVTAVRITIDVVYRDFVADPGDAFFFQRTEEGGGETVTEAQAKARRSYLNIVSINNDIIKELTVNAKSPPSGELAAGTLVLWRKLCVSHLWLRSRSWIG